MAWSSTDQNPTTSPYVGASPSAAYGTNYAAALNAAASYNPLGGGSSSTGMAPTGTTTVAPSGETDYAARLSAAAPAQTTSTALAAAAKGPPRTEAPTAAPDPVGAARAYLASVAQPASSMERQGVNQAIARLRPDFAVNLASTIQTARAEGIPVGPNSAFRDPVLDPGGYRDKWNSLHGMTMATDVAGLGGPGSPSAKKFYELSKDSGIVNPYGPRNRAEYNHYQATETKGRQFRDANPEAEVALQAYRQAGSPTFSPPNPNLSPRTSPAFGAAGARGPMPNDYPEPTGRDYDPAPELAALWRATGWQGEAGQFDGEPMMVAEGGGQDTLAGGNVPMPRERPQRSGASMAYAPAPEAMEAPFDAVMGSDRRPQPATPRQRPQRDTLATAAAPQAQTGAYIVQRGDNLSKIAQRALGDPNRWREIAQANGIRDPNVIQPGQKLVIPGVTAEAAPVRREVDMPMPRPRPERGANVPTPRMRPGQPTFDMRRMDDAAGPRQPRSVFADEPTVRWQERVSRAGPTIPRTRLEAAEYYRNRPDFSLAAGGDLGTPETQMSVDRPMRSPPAGPGMDTSGLIREPTAEERNLRVTQPNMMQGQPMDPQIAAQIRRTPAIITEIMPPTYVAPNGVRVWALR